MFCKVCKVSQIRVFASFHKYKFRKVSQIGFSFADGSGSSDTARRNRGLNSHLELFRASANLKDFEHYRLGDIEQVLLEPSRVYKTIIHTLPGIKRARASESRSPTRSHACAARHSAREARHPIRADRGPPSNPCTIVRGPAMGHHPACAQAASLLTRMLARPGIQRGGPPAASLAASARPGIMCAVRNQSSVAARPRYHVAARPGFKLLQSILSARVSPVNRARARPGILPGCPART